MKGRVTAADTKARFCECSKTEAKWPCLAQLQEGSFRRITVITAQTLTWAAAAGWRWMTIKPLPPDTTSRAAFQQTAVKPAPATARPAVHCRLRRQPLLPNPSWIRVIPARFAAIHYASVCLEPVTQPSPEYNYCMVVKRYKQGR